MSEELYALLKRRDDELADLRVYVEALEEELQQARGESAHENAREDAAKKISELRYQHGFKFGTGVPWRGNG